MELISIQKYAARNRLPIHTVIKKTMSGELLTQAVEENGKEVTYILLGEEKLSELLEKIEISKRDENEEIDYKKAYEDLNKEYLILKTKYDKLLAKNG